MDSAGKPHLVIFLEIAGILIKARCSHCTDVVFATGKDIGTTEEQHNELESLFREHFRKVHMHENAHSHAGKTKRLAAASGVLCNNRTEPSSQATPGKRRLPRHGLL